jgi:hypothetical protein
MFICFEKYCSVINLDLFWKHLFSHTGGQQKSLDDAPCTSLKETKLKPSYKAKEKFVKFKTNKEEQYKVIQNFQVPQKEQYKLLQIFKCYSYKKKKKKKKFYKLNSSTAKLSKPQHSTAPHSTAQKSTEQPGTPPPPERRCHKLQAQNL